MASTLKTNSDVNFDSMLKRFSVVTVMNASVYELAYGDKGEKLSATDVLSIYEALEPLCTLDTLKIANVTVEGPDKTVTGGQYSNPLVKFGKSARLEMQDALGKGEAIAYLGGGILEWDSISDNVKKNAKLHIGENFEGPKCIIGDSFFIDQKTGMQVKVKIIFYQFLPDSLFNLSQDAEGDATVFDMNGDLLTTNLIITGDTVSNTEEHTAGLFYSILDPVKIKKSSSSTNNDTVYTFANAKDIKLDTVRVYNATTRKELSKACSAVTKIQTASLTVDHVDVTLETDANNGFTVGNKLVIINK